MSIENTVLHKISKFLGESMSAALDTFTPIFGMDMSSTCKDVNQKIVQNTDFSGVMPAWYFNMAFSGDINGAGVAVFRDVDLSVILKILMNTDSEEVSFDEMGLGMIREIMNQLTSEFAGKLGSCLGLDIKGSSSSVMQFTDNNILTSELKCNEASNVYNLHVQYNVGTILKGRSIFVFDEEFVKSISDFLDDSTSSSKNTQSYKTSAESKVQTGAVKSPSVNVSPAAFPKFDDGDEQAEFAMGGNMDLLMDVPMNVCIEIGKTKKKMREIMNFTQGTVFSIDKQAGAPVDITVNGQLIARGDVIVIDDNFGVRITELLDNHTQNDK